MPKVRPLTEDGEVKYRKEQLARSLIMDIADLKIKRKDLAKIQGITAGSLSNQLTRRQITLETYLAWQILREKKIKELQQGECGNSLVGK